MYFRLNQYKLNLRNLKVCNTMNCDEVDKKKLLVTYEEGKEEVHQVEKRLKLINIQVKEKKLHEI